MAMLVKQTKEEDSLDMQNGYVDDVTVKEGNNVYQGTAVKIMNQINKVIIGKEDKVKLVMTALLARGHILLEDVPGVGKTTLANALAKSIQCEFGRIQFTPDTLPGDITGISIYNMKTGTFEYAKGAIMKNIVLADEINRTSPKTQASLLEAMEEKQVTVDGVIYPLEEPFLVIATQNPVDFLGTYNLPEAQLDRFLMKISLGYPGPEEECRMVQNYLADAMLQTVIPVATKDEVVAMQKEVAGLKVHNDIVDYTVRLVQATRKEEQFILGASPRATLAIIRAAQAWAYLDGRDYVIPDDIQEMLIPVLCHRFVLSMDAKITKVNSETVLKSLIKKISVPVLR